MAVSVRDLASLVFAPSRRDGWLGMLRAYFDDSGTHDQSDVVVIAGLIGTEAMWASVDAAWGAKLKAPLPGKAPLKRFHMAECEAGEGAFADYSRAERDAVIHDFRQIVLGSKVHGYGIGASRKDWGDTIKGDVQLAIGDAEMFCFADCLSRMAQLAGIFFNDSDLALVFDDRPPDRNEANRRVFGYYQAADRSPKLVGISFLSSEAILPLQAADMWAWETFNFTRDWLARGPETPARPHLRRIHETGRFEASVADRPTIQAFDRIIRAELEHPDFRSELADRVASAAR